MTQYATHQPQYFLFSKKLIKLSPLPGFEPGTSPVASHRSSLHCNVSPSFCSFLYNGVYFDGLKLSVSDVIVSQKGPNGDGKLRFFGQD